MHVLEWSSGLPTVLQQGHLFLGGLSSGEVQLWQLLG